MTRGNIKWFPLDRLTDLEAAIIGQLDGPRRAHRRDALAVALGLCGLRACEVAQLRFADLSVPMRLLNVRTRKGGPPRTIELSAGTLRELLTWDRRGQPDGDGDLLLPNCHGSTVHRGQFGSMAVRLFDQVLGPRHRLTFHCLRHTFAMRTYAETRDLFLVQRYLGHASVKTTEIYARSLASLPASCLPQMDRSEALKIRLKVVG